MEKLLSAGRKTSIRHRDDVLVCFAASKWLLVLLMCFTISTAKVLTKQHNMCTTALFLISYLKSSFTKSLFVKMKCPRFPAVPKQCDQ